MTINGVNDVPVIDNIIANQTASENVAFNFTIPGNTFSDVDKGDNLTYTATLEDGVDHIRLLSDNTFGFEDLPNGGDSDYNDMIVKISFSI
ncbi:DUF4114 domain-containing protein [Rivularia sp. PCC 7116]|uniref:DUF4114 domain-containing protein n=1 Tax=Rivularia sp. PCC 7116 TaxID=373994 RepID=UPI000A05956D|nr:DUF4114 domain-containing protein [Rivularia sp. PCC 7116]